MIKLKEFRFFEGITEDNIRKEKKELEAKGHDVYGFEKLELTNQFILFYNKRDDTKPSEADLAKPTFQSIPTEAKSNNNIDKGINLIKKYWMLSAAVGFGVFYYFIIYK